MGEFISKIGPKTAIPHSPEYMGEIGRVRHLLNRHIDLVNFEHDAEKVPQEYSSGIKEARNAFLSGDVRSASRYLKAALLAKAAYLEGLQGNVEMVNMLHSAAEVFYEGTDMAAEASAFGLAVACSTASGGLLATACYGAANLIKDVAYLSIDKYIGVGADRKEIISEMAGDIVSGLTFLIDKGGMIGQSLKISAVELLKPTLEKLLGGALPEDLNAGGDLALESVLSSAKAFVCNMLGLGIFKGAGRVVHKLSAKIPVFKRAIAVPGNGVSIRTAGMPNGKGVLLMCKELVVHRNGHTKTISVDVEAANIKELEERVNKLADSVSMMPESMFGRVRTIRIFAKHSKEYGDDCGARYNRSSETVDIFDGAIVRKSKRHEDWDLHDLRHEMAHSIENEDGLESKIKEAISLGGRSVEGFYRSNDFKQEFNKSWRERWAVAVALYLEDPAKFRSGDPYMASLVENILSTRQGF